MKDKYPSTSRSAQSDEEDNLFKVCKQILKTRVFQGCYQEQRYVDSLSGYRDLVVLDNSEADLKADLEYIRNRIVNFYKDPYLWVGVTLPEMVGTPAGICIWTALEKENTGFGNYWFLIKSISFKPNEIVIKMKPIREITTSNGNSDSKQNNIDANSDSKQNSINALRFMFLLLTSSLEFLKFLGEFSIRFLAEMRMWLHVGTPIILKIIDLFSKLVGGFFILVAMVFGFNRQRHSNNYDTRRLQSPYHE